MKIVATSDLHGHLPQIPECDLLLIAGDICPVQNHRIAFQRKWLDHTFRHWLDSVPAKHVVATWGNHDWIGDKAPDMVPSLRWGMLVDRGCEIDGLNIWGSPWQIPFCDWAFNLAEPMLSEKWAQIPHDTDIVVLHGPPYYYGDLAPAYPPRAEPEHVGSASLLARLNVVEPKLAVFGHIHDAYGRWSIRGMTLANVSLVNEAYRPVNEPMVFEI